MLQLFTTQQNFGLDLKLKALAVDKSNAAKMMISLYDRSKNTVEKEENAGFQHFLHFPQCFQKASFYMYKVVTSWDSLEKV